MKKLLLICITLFSVSFIIKADDFIEPILYDFEENGIYYLMWNSTEVAVTNNGKQPYSGVVMIPSSVRGYTVSNIYNLAFDRCTALTDVVIPSSVTSLGQGSFGNCTGLKSVYFPEDFSDFKIGFGYGAFAECSQLSKIAIPKNTTVIFDNAFYGCTGLMEIHCKPEVPLDIEPYTFHKVDKQKCILYVPVGTLDAYRDSEGWKDFINIKEDTGGVEDTSGNSIKVYTSGGNIIVKGAESGSTIEIYSSNGIKIKTSIVCDFETTIPVPTSNIYFVRTGTITTRVIL